MNILREPALYDRDEFGRAAVRGDDLREWVRATGAVLPPTAPDVTLSDVVHIETLLVAMYHGATLGLSDDQIIEAARAVLSSDSSAQVDPRVRRHIEDGVANTARHFLGGQVVAPWRGRLQAAVAAGALRTVDAVTGLATSKAADSPAIKPVQRQVAWKEAILEALRESALDPRALPAHQNGRADPSKSAARAKLVPAVMTKDNFERAWQQLRKEGAIANR